LQHRWPIFRNEIKPFDDTHALVNV